MPLPEAFLVDFSPHTPLLSLNSDSICCLDHSHAHSVINNLVLFQGGRMACWRQTARNQILVLLLTSSESHGSRVYKLRVTIMPIPYCCWGLNKIIYGKHLQNKRSVSICRKKQSRARWCCRINIQTVQSLTIPR